MITEAWQFLVIGICAGLVSGVFIMLGAMYTDWLRHVKQVKQRAYDEFEWDQIYFMDHSFTDCNAIEIYLPEVA